MTTEQIEKAIKHATKYKMPWKLLASKLMHPPFGLTAVDATRVLDEYKRRFPKAYQIAGTVTGRITDRQNVQPVEVVERAVVLAQSGIPPESNYTQSILNRSAVKDFALAVVKEKRAGKFERVSKQFVQNIEAEVEALIRGIGPADDREIAGEWDFLNRKAVRPKVEQKLNYAIRKIILRKVCSHPTLGKTLK